MKEQTIPQFALLSCVSVGYTPIMAEKDAGLRVRVERELREQFLAACREQDKPAAQVLREFMRRYVADRRRHRPGATVITDYQSKYIAHDLTRRRSSDSTERLAVAVAGAQVDMNPHQVDAALFAFASPLSKGALLADEVGLGKTIEAGLVISQRWAEGKRRILIIAPANLRKQWHQEMNEKFFIPCTILEAKSYNAEIKADNFKPFETQDSVVICSYQFARSKAADVATTYWDLVVIDEAHRLRNVYKPSNVIANILKSALAERNKLLLTATPLQNSLLELFGLVSFIDEHSFGDLKASASSSRA
ncbi:SNF2-related protein [Hankyongella ginsenosidimutans]|uniref:SNF2-related protein n=1 Tax=Hankyongella ginsenosidimutans TaxID=1763828 RepID=UPI001FE300B5|nr:SNF2-related protein [Hankyongella ginsenosidimutans]